MLIIFVLLLKNNEKFGFILEYRQDLVLYLQFSPLPLCPATVRYILKFDI